MGSLQSLRETIESIDYRIYKSKSSIDSIDKKCAESQEKNMAIAESLLAKLGEQNSWKFYLKCSYRLSEDEIWHFVELACRPHVVNKNRYFVKLASDAMR